MSVHYKGEDAQFIVNCLKTLRSLIKTLNMGEHAELLRINEIVNKYDTANNKSSNLPDERLRGNDCESCE
jgi:hypothetical protein